MISSRPVFQRIFCPIDLSPASNGSLRYAVALARLLGAEMLVCHCLDSAHPDEAVREGIRQRVDELTFDNILFSPEPMPKWKLSLITGDPRRALVEEAEAFGADLIVMCAKSKPHTLALIGSTAQVMCRKAPCPVLVTRQPEREWVGLTTNQSDLREILVAFDFSSQAELALAYGLSLARQYQAHLHVVFVMAPPHESTCQEAANRIPAAELTPGEFLDLLGECLPPETQTWCQTRPVVLEGQPANEILAYASAHEIDLICMGVHDPGFGMKPLLGSNVDRVLRHLPCPLLAVRPVQPARAISAQAELEEEPDNYSLVY